MLHKEQLFYSFEKVVKLCGGIGYDKETLLYK